ncbi:MAG: winged helix-turn-helix transcriptional regulator [Deltaproteobacteria bacterium]|nr:winged helix-turn-helix transcriptional regulator [Deltaproteobacteria bacterium]
MDEATRQRITELRQKGLNAREIARAVKLSPSVVTEVIRQLAAARGPEEKPPAYLECYVSNTWRQEVALRGPPQLAPPDWQPQPPSGIPKLIQIAVVAGDSPSLVAVHVFLVDPGCLGVKNCFSRKRFTPGEVRALLTHIEEGSGQTWERVSLATVRELVFGAVDFARSLGFEPVDGFARCAGVLGPWAGPCVFAFSRGGKPFYVSGPHDDVPRIMQTLRRSVGEGNFDSAAIIT